jgi:hypothetical protein
MAAAPETRWIKIRRSEQDWQRLDQRAYECDVVVGSEYNSLLPDTPTL